MSGISRVWSRLSIAFASVVCASTLAFASPEDEIPPSVPGNLTATAVSGSQINLSWTASTDNPGGGIYGYNVYRCQGASCVYIGFQWPSPTSFSSTGLSSGVTYGYQVIAVDTSGNQSDPATASATTFDVVAPNGPGSLSAGAASGTQINLSWPAASDNVGVTGYQIEMCAGVGCGNFAYLNSTASTSDSTTGLTPATSYSFRVRAYDAASNMGGYSPTASATTPDTVPPSPPGSLSASAASGTQINLSWSASSDNVGVTGYAIERCQGAGCSNFAYLTTVGTTSYSSTGLTPATAYSFRVRAHDAANNYSGYSAVASAITHDTEPPTPPGSFAASATSSGTQINLTWSASTDNVNVTGYAIERCEGAGCSSFAYLATATTTSYNDTGLTPATTYRYRVRAHDAVPNYSGYSGVASATTPDTIAPLAPATLAASAASATQINLSWSASTDNVAVTGYLVERCEGASCTSFAQIATPTGTTFSDTGLADITTYRYRVRARDAVPNYSGYSPIATATTPDGQPPSVPSGLTATAASATQINLTWTASTDNVGVTGYLVERCQGAACSDFSQIATPTTTSYNNTGLTNGTTYRYRVRARDAIPNYSGYSAIAAATTPDNEPPSVPSGLAATPISATQINLSWTASTDNVGVTGYLVDRCEGAACTTFSQIATPATNSYNDTGRSPGATYRYRVRARDAVPNYSGYSTIVTATTPTDAEAPTAPSGVMATAASSTQINLSWTASTDNVAVTGYLVERCEGAGCTTFAQVGTPTSTSFNDIGLAPNTTYRYRVSARDAVPNYSAYSAVVSAATPPDTQAPTAPGSPAATAASSTQINLTWTASTDDVAVTGYLVERCQVGATCPTFTQIATPTGASFNNTGLAPSTTYQYRVRAQDAVPNYGAYSATVSATTPADTQAPSIPTNLTGTAISGTQINLSWTASTDNVGVTGYQVDRCQGAGCTSFSQIGTPTTNSYSSTGLTQATTYRYRVRARDAANNVSDNSSIVTVTTWDTQPPTAPSGLTATASATASQVLLTWTASTDNVGVTAYSIERCGGAGCTYSEIASVATTSYTDTSVAVATTYSYRVRARDAAGNFSAYSTVGGTVTADCD